VFLSGAGSDRFAGTDAADVFRFSSAKNAGLGKLRDIITDFEAGSDIIDLSGIDANAKTSGDNAFKTLLTGHKAFTKAGQLHYDGKTGILSGNTDKDAAAEFQIVLKNKPLKLALDYFVL
jgi:serralysin